MTTTVKRLCGACWERSQAHLDALNVAHRDRAGLKQTTAWARATLAEKVAMQRRVNARIIEHGDAWSACGDNCADCAAEVRP